MTEDWERVRGLVRGFVERVAVEYCADTVVIDADLGPSARQTRDVRVVLPGEEALGALAPVDLVVAIDPPARAARWEEYLAERAKKARKALLVLASNAERLGHGAGPDTTALASVLWQLGRVREHAYLGLPRMLGAFRVVQAPAGALVRRTARWHAFAVDTAPRTPQARRRLRTVGEGNGPPRGPMRTT